jgi:hypothetical protein
MLLAHLLLHEAVDALQALRGEPGDRLRGCRRTRGRRGGDEQQAQEQGGQE